MIQSAGNGAHHFVGKKTPKPYQKVNGCKNSMPLWQVIGLAIFLAIEILSLNLIKTMFDLDYIHLYVLFGIKYCFLIFVVIDYLILMLGDPSDPRLANSSYKEPDQKLKHCSQCEAEVSEKSHHCKTCNRCVDDFDHHCVFLNNCIGKQNYSAFFLLLLGMICHMSLNIGIGVSMFMQLDNNFAWVALSLAILSFLIFLEVIVLAIFHCYISFWLFKTTLQVLRGGDSSKKISGQPTEVVVINKQKQRQTINVVKMEEKIEEPTQMVFKKGQNQL